MRRVGWRRRGRTFWERWRQNLPRNGGGEIRGGGQDSIKLNKDRGRQLAHESEPTCGVALSQVAEVQGMDFATGDRGGEWKECHRSCRQHDGEAWEWNGFCTGSCQDAVQRTIRAELLIQKDKELVPWTFVQEGVLVDADYGSATEERGEERKARLAWDVDHSPSKARKEIVVMLRQFQVFHGLGRDPRFIEKEKPVVDLFLGTRLCERLMLVRKLREVQR